MNVLPRRPTTPSTPTVAALAAAAAAAGVGAARAVSDDFGYLSDNSVASNGGGGGERRFRSVGGGGGGAREEEGEAGINAVKNRVKEFLFDSFGKGTKKRPSGEQRGRDLFCINKNRLCSPPSPNNNINFHSS